MMNVIETWDLCFRAGKDFELRDLALKVREGSIYGFLGPNGAGKSTTIKLLMGMLRPRSGQISVLGLRAPEQMPRILADVGYVPERPHLYPFLTVEAAVNYHAAFFPSFDMPYAAELLDQFNLPRSRPVRALSKGESGKLHMLLVLAQRPKLLVLDEPTDGLDPVVRRDVLSALLDFCSQGSTTVFISSHLVHELERICDWVGVVDKGRLVAELPMHAESGGRHPVRRPDAGADDARRDLDGAWLAAPDGAVVRGVWCRVEAGGGSGPRGGVRRAAACLAHAGGVRRCPCTHRC